MLVGSLICAVIDISILLVYVALWDKQSCHGWSIMVMVTSMISFYAAMASPPVTSFAYDAISIQELTFFWLCYSSILTIQFSFLCTYCWTLVLAYDVWRTLRRLSPRGSSSRGLRRFLLYCAFGYGLPAFVVATSFAVFSLTNSDYPKNCRDYIEFFRIRFVYLPSGIILGCNVVLMYLTVKHLREAKKNRGDLRVHGKSEGSSSYTNAKLIWKLMVLMGAFLLLDMVIHFLDVSGIGESIYSLCFEYLYRIVHSSCLVWVFVCNNEIRDELAVKFPAVARYVTQKWEASISAPIITTESSLESGSSK